MKKVLGIASFIMLLLFFTGLWRLVFAQATTGFTKVNTSPITTTSFTSGTLTDGTAISVEVTAVNAAGEGPPSTIVSGVIPTTGTHTFTFTWTPPTVDATHGAAVSYNVYDQIVTPANPPLAPQLVIN